MRRALLTLTTFLLALAGGLACDSGGSATGSQDGAAHASPAKAEDSHAGHDHPKREERPLPAFDGRLLSGEKRSISSFIGKRMLLFFFNPEVKQAGEVADAISRIAAVRGDHNFEVVGVAMASSYDKVTGFVEEHGLDFPVFDDSSARISNRLGMRSPLMILGVDNEGFLSFGMSQFPEDIENPTEILVSQLRSDLRIPAPGERSGGKLDQRPLAPLFEAPRMEGGEPFRLADRRGKPTVVIFFLHTCPHCHAALRFFKGQLAKLPEGSRPELVGISLQERPSAVRAMLKDEGLDYFPVLFDPDMSATNAYGVFGGVPVVLLIDKTRRIAHRIQGWDEARDPALARMVLAQISETPIPMILNPKGYTGSDVCGVCHQAEHQTWNFSSHAVAFDTLVTHGKEKDAECVGCHVVGFEEAGGFSLSEAPEHLEDVGCETCHGRGGPHLSPEFVKNGDYEAVCAACHNPEHSLGFEYASFLPRISHAAVAALSNDEREAMLASHGKPRDLLPTTSETVGSESCKGCHASEYATWLASPHAHAVATLEKKGEAANADCLKCHTTAFGRTGGFPKEGAVADHPDLARVGCESCHGPGGAHVAEGSRKLGSIVSLGDKCDSCVILQICGSCHDDANDPGFRFRVEERIEAQRHGTIEAGTGKPLPPDAASRGPLHPAPGTLPADLARAFSLLDSRG